MIKKILLATPRKKSRENVDLLKTKRLLTKDQGKQHYDQK